MKSRLYFLIYLLLALTGISRAQAGLNLQEHRQTLLYAFIGLSALLVILVIWELLDMMSKGGKATITTPQINIVGSMEEAPPEEEDPIKALLKKQAEVISSGEEEEELPAFLKESSGGVEDLARPEAPPPGMPATIGKASPPRIPESHADADPFKALLMKSAHQEEKAAPEERDETVEPTIPLARVKGKSIRRDEEDPFKSLLKSKREEKVSTGGETVEEVPPVKKPIPIQSIPRADVGIPAQPPMDQPSGVEVKVPKIKGLKPPPKPAEKKASLSPPKPASLKGKKIAFSLPGKKKSRSVGRLFSRLSEAKKTEEENQALNKPAPPKIKPSITPETLEKAIKIEPAKVEQPVVVPTQKNVVLKLPGSPGEPRKPEKPKMLDLDLEGKKKKLPEQAGEAEEPESKTIPSMKPTKRLTLNLAQPGKETSNLMEPREKIEAKKEVPVLKPPSTPGTRPLFTKKIKGMQMPSTKPKPTKIFRQIPKPASTKMLRPGGLPEKPGDDK